jgi:hypothetical protein
MAATAAPTSMIQPLMTVALPARIVYLLRAHRGG